MSFPIENIGKACESLRSLKRFGWLGGFKMKALMNGKEIDIKLSKKAQAELNEIDEKVTKMLQPLYEGLSVDMKTEALYWSSGEVFVINKKTGKRREIEGKSQFELNRILIKDAVDNAKKVKKDGPG